MNKLILLCLGLFIFVTAQVSTAETALQQKAKQTGLNTASQNQMLTQKLGTELMVKSTRLIVLTYDFTKNGATSGTFTFKEKGTGNTGKVPKCHVLSANTGGHVTISTPTTVVVSGSATLDIVESVASGVVVDDWNIAGLAPALTTNLAVGPSINDGIASCASDATITGVVSGGTIVSGQLDVIMEVTPYNQTP